MKSETTDEEAAKRKKELLLEFFLNAFALAFVKELALVPVTVEERRKVVPQYYRG